MTAVACSNNVLCNILGKCHTSEPSLSADRQPTIDIRDFAVAAASTISQSQPGSVVSSLASFLHHFKTSLPQRLLLAV